MARMHDTSSLPGQYSLEKLSNKYHSDIINIRNRYIKKFEDYCKLKIKEIQDLNNNDNKGINEYNLKINNLNVYKNFNNSDVKKIDMKTLFQYKKTLKNGEEGKTYVMPTIQELHTNIKYREKWIIYSILDTECTYYLRDVLQEKLQSMLTKAQYHINPITEKYKNNYELYLHYWRQFGELLTDMEREGIKLDLDYLKQIQLKAETDLKIHENSFLNWVYSIDSKLVGFNPGSTQQMQQLLFGPCYRSLTNFNKEKILKNQKEEYMSDEELAFDNNTEDINQDYNSNTKKTKSDKIILIVPETRVFKIDNEFVSLNICCYLNITL